MATIGSTCPYVINDFFLGEESFRCCKETYVPGYSPKSCGVSGIFAGISLVSILQADNSSRVSTPVGHYFSIYNTTMDWHQDSV